MKKGKKQFQSQKITKQKSKFRKKKSIIFKTMNQGKGTNKKGKQIFMTDSMNEDNEIKIIEVEKLFQAKVS